MPCSYWGCREVVSNRTHNLAQLLQRVLVLKNPLTGSESWVCICFICTAQDTITQIDKFNFGPGTKRAACQFLCCYVPLFQSENEFYLWTTATLPGLALSCLIWSVQLFIEYSYIRFDELTLNRFWWTSLVIDITGKIKIIGKSKTKRNQFTEIPDYKKNIQKKTLSI